MTITLTLPAIEVAASTTQTGAGRIVLPGCAIPAKKIAIDPEKIQRLVLAARAAAGNAYAPYSRFRVGSAIIMADDPEETIYPGANIENSSYGVTCCAERSALFHCAALGFRRLKYLAVSCLEALDSALAERSPCGICRQAIKEFTQQDIAADEALIFIDSGDPDTLCEIFDIERLLPYGFNFGGSD